MTAHHVVIIGAGAAGTSAARALAGQNNIKTTIVGQTDEVPYIRMLIKGVVHGLTTPDFVRMPLPQVDLLTDTAELVDSDSRRIHLASGATIVYDSLIVTTGSRAQGLDSDIPGAEQAAAAETLSTLYSLEDAVRIRDLVPEHGKSQRIAIYGGGIAASETVSTLHEEGHHVSLITRSAIPGIATFGRPIAERLAVDHQRRVNTYFGRTIRAIYIETDATIVSLDDGTDLAVDLVILALGTTPVAPGPWREGAVVDDRLRVHHVEGVYAAGGVAVHHDDYLGTWRIDHWDDAAAQGTHAAQMLLHVLGRCEDPGPYRPRSVHMAMIYGQVIAGAGYIGKTTSRVKNSEEFVVLHEDGNILIGVSGIDAVGAVYQWAKHLHKTSAPGIGAALRR